MSENKIYNKILIDAGVPRRHNTFRPADNKHPKWSENYNKLKSSIEDCGTSAILGKRGTGKTQIGCCLIGHAIYNINKNEFTIPAMYMKFLDIIIRLRPESSETTENKIQYFLRPFLLVIDAYENRSGSEFEFQMVNHIIDKRYDANIPTVIISNDSLVEFSESIGESIIERIRETGGIYLFNWESFRKKI